MPLGNTELKQPLTICSITDLSGFGEIVIFVYIVSHIIYFLLQKGTITKKDRCLFLFNDMLVCATVKRKANALRRGSLSM